MLVEPPICMRLSSRKVAHSCSRPVLRGRKYGKPPTFAWFSLKENHTSPLLPDHSDCENALSLGDARPDQIHGAVRRKGCALLPTDDMAGMVPGHVDAALRLNP